VGARVGTLEVGKVVGFDVVVGPDVGAAVTKK
jgi:hypothetical protein